MLTGNRNDVKVSGECEVCDKKDIRVSLHYGNMWFCDECWAKEQTLSVEHMSPENQQKRVEAYKNSVESKVIEVSKIIDNSIQVRTDQFNAATVAIVDIKKAIDENPEVTNKPYALAEVLTERFKHYQQVGIEAQQTLTDAGNHQKAIQVYLNNLANQLRAEEREKLRIADISYNPQPIKPTVKKITTTGTTKKPKFDKVELRKYAAELGVSEFTLQSVVVSNGITVEAAANKLRRSINEAKSMIPEKGESN